MATPSTLIRLAVSCMLAGSMLAACGGSQIAGSSVGTTPQAGAASQHSVSPAWDGGGGGCGGDGHGGGLGPNDGGGCCGDGHNWGGGGGDHCHNITVTPHEVYFTVSNPGPVSVTVKTRQQGSVSEVDDCGGASGIAMLTEGTGSQANQWTVTAGAQTGSCKALFILDDTSGQKIGHAVLHITNFL